MRIRAIPSVVLGAWGLAVALRLFLLIMLHDNYFGTGISIADGELAVHLSRGEGFVVNEAHMTTVWNMQSASHKLIDLEDVPRPPVETLTPYHHALPGYSVLLAFFNYLTGRERYLDLQIFQAVLDSFGVLFMYLLGARVFSEKAGIISAFLYALWVPEARLAIAPFHDAPMAFLILFATLIFVKAEDRNSPAFFALSGLVLGLGSYIRSDFILLPVFFSMASAAKRHSLRPLLHGALMLGIIALVLLPWGFRNYTTFHRFTILRPVLWQSIWEGFGEFPNPFGAVQDDIKTFEQVHKDHPGISYTDPEYQDVLREKSLAALKGHPGWYLSILPRRLARMLLSPNDWGFPRDPRFNYEVLKGQGWGPLRYLKNYPEQFAYRFIARAAENLVFLIALLGIWMTRREWRKYIILLSVPVCGILTHLPIYWEPRYLLPGNFPYLLLSSAAVEMLRARAGRPR